MKGRKSFSQNDDVTEINISPLIDMVFILLIFFIVTTVFVEEKGMAANTPDPSSVSEPNDNEPVAFLIRSNGSVVFRGRNVGVGGVRAIVRPEMQREVTPITVNVESKALTNLVVRVMDECYLGGAESVSMKAVNE
ncbi:biopolymer transporter ExbD [Puniceicoccaceae bacterium K14]|nr:biopolymer transporter ExbD [Puniceicoccaceae bacterium K14]